MYYLLFAAQSGLLVTDAEIQAIMDEFVAMLYTVPDYLTINPTSDTLAGMTSNTVNFTFNTTGINAGIHEARITVTNTTPPFASYFIKTRMEVTGFGEVNFV